jgi:hypothetical protein
LRLKFKVEGENPVRARMSVMLGDWSTARKQMFDLE